MANFSISLCQILIYQGLYYTGKEIDVYFRFTSRMLGLASYPHWQIVLEVPF